MDTPAPVIKTQMSFVTTIQGDKAIVASAVIGFLRGKRVGGSGGNISARGRKSWCLHKILISDTSQSGIRYKGSYEKGVSYDIRARLYLSLFYFVCVGFSHEGSSPTHRVRPPPFAILSSTNSNNANWHVTPLSQQRQTYHARGVIEGGVGYALRDRLGTRKDTSFLSPRRGSIAQIVQDFGGN